MLNSPPLPFIGEVLGGIRNGCGCPSRPVLNYSPGRGAGGNDRVAGPCDGGRGGVAAGVAAPAWRDGQSCPVGRPASGSGGNDQFCPRKDSPDLTFGPNIVAYCSNVEVEGKWLPPRERLRVL